MFLVEMYDIFHFFASTINKVSKIVDKYYYFFYVNKIQINLYIIYMDILRSASHGCPFVT